MKPTTSSIMTAGSILKGSVPGERSRRTKHERQRRLADETRSRTARRPMKQTAVAMVTTSAIRFSLR